MCGFFVATKCKLTENSLAKIGDLLSHRGPDSLSISFEDNLQLSMVFARLAIQDLSIDANQPLFSEDKRYILLYNGEIYNKDDLAVRVPGSRAWQTSCDTEILLYSLIERGIEETLRDIEGMFAFVFVDTQTRELFAARDMFGIKPLYYAGTKEGGVVFASEIKSLKPLMDVSVNQILLREFLLCGLIDHTNSTLVTGVRKVVPGTYLRIFQNRIEEIKWAQTTNDLNVPSKFSDFVNFLEEEFITSMGQAIVSDVPVGMTLSSGVDSNLIRVLLNHFNMKPRMILVDWGNSIYSETDFLTPLLRNSHDLVVESFSAFEVLDLVEESFYHHDEPYTSAFVAIWPEVYMRAKSKGIGVVLDGSGADELFYGYSKYQTSLSNFSQKALDGKNVSLGPQSYFVSQPSSLEEARLLDIFSLKLPRSLRFSDYASMSASLELRPFYLTRRKFLIANQAPIEWMISDVNTKLILRKILGKLDPAYDVNQLKKSVQLPQNEWLHTEWRSHIMSRICETGNILDLVTDNSERELIVEQVQNYSAGATGVNLNFIWRLFITQKWLEAW